MPRKRTKYANTPKTGSKSIKNYDPKTTDAARKGGKPSVVKRYNPPKGAQQGGPPKGGKY